MESTSLGNERWNREGEESKVEAYGNFFSRKKYFMMGAVRHWNRLPREAVDAPSLEAFEARLDEALSNLV